MTDKNTSLSSDKTQRDLRLKKLEILKKRGIDPFTAESKRDWELGFVKFWFNLVGKFDFRKIDELDNTIFTTHYFLENVLFPQNLVERMEERLQIRQTVREMGLDPDNEEGNIEEEFDPEIIKEARELLPRLSMVDEETRFKYLQKLLSLENTDEDEDLEDETGEKEVKLALELKQKVTLVGRIKSKRVSGKIAFATVVDESCRDGFQFIFKQDDLQSNPENPQILSFSDYKDLFDEGDFIEATGILDFSLRGEPSLFVQEFRILTKTLKPIPDKLEDKEARFRQRYLDMLVNLEVKEVFDQKSKFWTATKKFMDKNGFTQVFTPIMQETTGGAEANPFVTHHDSLDQDFYLGISPELYLKRMIVGGYEKIYDLGRNFRNEGIDDEHLQEFNRMEFSWAYANHEELMKFTEDLMKYSLESAFGSLQLIYKKKDENGDFTGEEILVDWSKAWPKMSYYDFIKHFGGVDLVGKTETELAKIATDLGIKFEDNASFGRLTDLIYKKIARPKCIEPVWLIDIPTRMSPLAKRDPKNPENTLRSHLLAYGSELSNGYAELNDPIDQLERFEEQQSARDGGDDEAMMIDMDFVEALEIGMPPMVGFAYSDRLFDLLANKTMREATAFPLMKKKENGDKLKKKTMVAHAIILDNSEIPLWSKMNAVAHLSASLGAREGKEMIEIDSSKTKDGEIISMNIRHAIIIKKTDQKENLINLKKLAEVKKLIVTCFTEEMRDSSNDIKVKENQESKNNNEIGYLGILIYGKKSDVEELTDNFKLLE
jgi:lysyl-tRNA synthetase class 2